MEEPETTPERRAELRAAVTARLAQERAEQLARVAARNAGAVAAIPERTARQYVHLTDPRLAAALREKRERQRDERANRAAARQVRGWNFTPYSGGRRKAKAATVTPAVRTVQPARAVAPHNVQTFTEVMAQVGADRKWFATGANQ